jgi:ABC-type nitrate/sulfonate/bicarbonate transport system substrate-binding protein
VLGTRKDSPIRNVADLKGKTVGALLGGDPYNVLSQWLRYELGNPDPRAHSITVVNTPTAAQAATIPTGMDAAVLIYPAFLKANADLGTVGILNSFGYTESHYKGPAGEGAGHLIESVKKSPFYPDGFYLHRSFWIGHPNMIKTHPNVVTAFVLAQQDAVAKLSGMDAGQVSELSRKYWELPPELGSKVVKDDVLFARGWCWPTEGDAQALLETSKYMVEGRLIPKPLAWSQVRDAFAPASVAMRACLREERPQARCIRIRGEGRRRPARRAGVGHAALARAHVSLHIILEDGRAMIVGFIGLGTMGRPMARNILAKGHRLIVYDVQAAAVSALAEAGAAIARTPREVAEGSEIVITMLPDAPDVERAALGADGVCRRHPAGIGLHRHEHHRS